MDYNTNHCIAYNITANITITITITTNTTNTITTNTNTRYFIFNWFTVSSFYLFLVVCIHSLFSLVERFESSIILFILLLQILFGFHIGRCSVCQLYVTLLYIVKIPFLIHHWLLVVEFNLFVYMCMKHLVVFISDLN